MDSEAMDSGTSSSSSQGAKLHQSHCVSTGTLDHMDDGALDNITEGGELIL